MQISMNPFLLLERGDDLSALAIDRRQERFRIAFNGQVFYAINSWVPIVKVGGTVLGIAKIEEVSSSVSPSGVVMTYVTFSRTQISKDYQKAFKMIYQLQSNTDSDPDDIYANVDAVVPGAISPEQLERMTGLKSSTPSHPVRPMKPKEPSLSDLPSARDLFGGSSSDEDDEDYGRDRKRRRDLFSDI